MKRSLGALLALMPALSGGTDGDDTASHTVDIRAEMPVVAITPRAADRQFLQLPSLEYRFEVDAQCDTGWQPESFSLNVADSRVALTAPELNEPSAVPVLLRIPARQIAPVAIAGFCVIDPEEEGSANGKQDSLRQMTVGGALSANASLVCRSDEAREITYAARALDVVLTCEAPATDSW